MFQVEFTAAAQTDLARLDKPMAQRVLKKLRWLAENFEAIIPGRIGINQPIPIARVGWRKILKPSSRKH